MTEVTDVPPGYRRFELVYHTVDAVDGYLAETTRLMDAHSIPEEERGPLRLKLLDMVSGRQVSIVPENPMEQQAVRVAAPPPGFVVPR